LTYFPDDGDAATLHSVGSEVREVEPVLPFSFLGEYSEFPHWQGRAERGGAARDAAFPRDGRRASKEHPLGTGLGDAAAPLR
jgi:hypothetical protein